MEDHRQRLLLIGAGPTGLAMAKALGEAGIAFLHVEATDHVGGNWAHGVYETAHIISSRRTTEYPDHPMPDDYPDFPSAAQMKAYYESFADAHDLRSAIRFGAAVEAVRRRDDDLWESDLSDGATVLTRGVVVCNGHHWSRSLPDWAADAPVEILHSKDYKRPEMLRGRRVLVVGGGNSGCDLASEAARVSARADWSLRRGYWILPKLLLGRPTVEMMKPWLPVAVQRLLIGLLLRIVVGRYADYGLPHPDHRLFDAHPTVSTEALHYLRHGRLRPRPDVAGFEGPAVRFADGATEEYDLIVCATGFDVTFPFLPPGMVEVVGKTPQLVAGMLTRRDRHLYVMGGYQVRYGIGPLLRPLALLLADLVRLQDELSIPLGQVLEAMGEKPPTTHLVDPHRAIRQMRRGRRMLGLVRWYGKRLERRRRSPAPAAVPR